MSESHVDRILSRESMETVGHEVGVFFLFDNQSETLIQHHVEHLRESVELASFVDALRQPHISLFQGSFPHELSVNTLQNIVQKIVEKLNLSEVEMEEKYMVRPNGNIFWNVKSTELLFELHNELLKELQPFTEGLLMQQFQEILDESETPQTDREQIMTYGSLLAGPSFLPHITLGKLKDISDKNSVLEIEIPAAKIKLGPLQMGEIRKDGSVSSARLNNG